MSQYVFSSIITINFLIVKKMSENVASLLEKLVQKEAEQKQRISNLRQELDDLADTEKNSTKIKYLQSQIEKCEEKIKNLNVDISKYRWENAKTGIFSLVALLAIVLLVLVMGDQLGYFSLPKLIESLFETKEVDVNDQIREMMRQQREEFEYGMKNY